MEKNMLKSNNSAQIWHTSTTANTNHEIIVNETGY